MPHKNPEDGQLYWRTRSLKHKFNLSIEDYETILEFQEGVCAICSKPPKTRRLSVDHDHKTGLVRGLLCYKCNYILGRIGGELDDVVDGLIYYSRHHPATEALGKETYGIKGPAQNTPKKASKKKKRRSKNGQNRT